MQIKPLQLAFWLLVTGVSFGLGLGWAWLFWLGLLGPVALLVFALLVPLTK
ncbi:MAG: hypothetical protein H7Z77_03670 [Chitinophagaceae bacterium]|nr:hypothetical protein [Polaromonas sp.]